MKHFVSVFLALALLGGSAAHAKITLPSVISDNMVLQQNTGVTLWGWSDSGKKVSVITGWDKKNTVAIPDAYGKWTVKVTTPAGSMRPYEISISDGEKTILRNILIGEVWYCSGQSNMEMPVKGYASQPAEGGTDAIMAARPERPIRICNIKKCSSTTVKENTTGSWQLHTPENVANISATAYFFADYLQAHIDVPVGILVTSWGGSSIETWLDRETIERDFAGEFDLFYLGQPWDKSYGKKDHQWPCLLYNGQVNGLVPYTFKGIIWYQGEANRSRPEQYLRLMQSYAKMMRDKFQNPDAPYYFVQIAPYNYDRSDSVNSYVSGYLYEAQQKASELIPHSGMAGTLDIGEYGTIHPRRKREVGQRLALLALVNDYGFKGVDPVCPTFQSVTFDGGKATVRFKVDKLGLSPMGVMYEGFEIAGADKVFHKAKATRAKDKACVDVWSDEVPEPVAVRYGFRNWAVGSVFNNYGIPAAPFRTDDWTLEEAQ